MRILAAVVVVLALAAGALRAGVPADYAIAEGDIVFQSLPHSPLVDAIEGATHSPWSHCGIVVRRGDGWAVLEAIGPVKFTPFDDWVAQSRDDRFVAYRLREPDTKVVAAMIAAAATFLGRPYDIRYQMDDEKIYCSELVAKAFNRATGRPLGEPRRLGDLDWKPHEALIRQIEGGGLPLDREMITPQALTESPELAKVY